MKICCFGNAESPQVQMWVRYFAEKGHEVHLISYIYAEIKNVKLHYIGPFPPIRYSILFVLIFKLRKIKKIIKEIEPDIVHGHFLTQSGFCASASGFKPLIVSAWGSDVLIAPRKSIIFKFILEYVLKRADIIHSVADHLTAELIHLGADKEKIITVPIGANTGKFNPGVNGPEIRKSLDWKDSPIVISTRRFEPVYNIECLINAAPLVIKEFPDAKFILIGNGTLENKFKNMVKELDILDSVKFIGWVKHNEIPGYLSCADVYVSTSFSDGTSVSLLEAMSCALPVVVTNIESNKVWIKNGENGYLFERKDSHTLAEHIISSIRDKKKSKVFGEKNREIVKERGNWGKNMEEMEKLYINLVKNMNNR